MAFGLDPPFVDNFWTLPYRAFKQNTRPPIRVLNYTQLEVGQI